MTITLTRDEAQQVLDALQCATPPTFSAKIVEDWQSAVEFLRARLSAPEPEPVAWGVLNTRPTERQTLMMVMIDQPPPSDFVVPLYLAPPQRECASEVHDRREWQGLTDEEIMEMLDYGQYGRVPAYARNFVDAIEAKLKEKNA